MASGKDHATASMIATIPVSVFVWTQTGDIVPALMAGVGSIAGVFLSPDLDINHKTVSERYFNVWFGKVVGKVWFLLWWPYAMAIPHRHWTSHFPIVGTIGRLAYLWLVLRLFNVVVPITEEVVWFFVGLAVADVLHWVMDGFPLFGIDERLGIKRRPRRRTNARNRTQAVRRNPSARRTSSSVNRNVRSTGSEVHRWRDR